MKGQIIVSLRGLIIALILAAVLIGSMLFLTQINIVGYLTGSCGNGFCEPDIGEDINNCPSDCTRVTTDISFEHLIVNPSDDLTFKPSWLYEYINFPEPGKLYCFDCDNAQACEDTFYYENALNCFDCDTCDPLIGNCSFCDSCEIVSSDYPSDNINYINGTICYLCTDCDINQGEDFAETCGSCDLCEYAENPSDSVVSYDKCDYCSSCDINLQNCEGCLECYNSYNNPSRDIKFYNLCNESSRCSSCEENSEPAICERIKDCIANYEGTPCDIDYILPVYGSNINQITQNLLDNIKESVRKCNAGPIFRELMNSGEQFVCNFNPKTFSYSEGGDTKKIFNDCGSAEETVYNVDGSSVSFGINSISYNKFAFGNPPGMNYKLVTGRVSYGGSSKNCDFNLFLCGQPAVATSDDDKIQDIYTKILNFNFHNYLEIGNNHEWKTIKYPAFTVNLNYEKDRYDIANTIVAGLRDLSLLIRNDEDTINFLCNDILRSSECEEIDFIEINPEIEWSVSYVGRPSECLSYGDMWDLVVFSEESCDPPCESQTHSIPGMVADAYVKWSGKEEGGPGRTIFEASKQKGENFEEISSKYTSDCSRTQTKIINLKDYQGEFRLSTPLYEYKEDDEEKTNQCLLRYSEVCYGTPILQQHIVTTDNKFIYYDAPPGTYTYTGNIEVGLAFLVKKHEFNVNDEDYNTIELRPLAIFIPEGYYG